MSWLCISWINLHKSREKMKNCCGKIWKVAVEYFKLDIFFNLSSLKSQKLPPFMLKNLYSHQIFTDCVSSNHSHIMYLINTDIFVCPYGSHNYSMWFYHMNLYVIEGRSVKIRSNICNYLWLPQRGFLCFSLCSSLRVLGP